MIKYLFVNSKLLECMTAIISTACNESSRSSRELEVLHDGRPDHANVPLIGGFSKCVDFTPAAEEIILGFFESTEIIDLAASKDSPLQNCPAVQKAAAQRHQIAPKECAKQVRTIEAREAAAEEAKRLTSQVFWARVKGAVIVLLSLALLAVVVYLTIIGCSWSFSIAPNGVYTAADWGPFFLCILATSCVLTGTMGLGAFPVLGLVYGLILCFGSDE